MKFLASVLFVLAFGSVTLIAQNPDRNRTQAANSKCPVSLRVQQSVSGDLLDAKDSGHEGTGQRLHLTGSNPQNKQITGGTVTVHGLTSKGRVQQTLSNQEESSDVAITLDVTFSTGLDKAVSGYLWVPGLTAVRAIDLKSVTYVDGTSWKLAAGETCHFLLDGVMPVGGH